MAVAVVEEPIGQRRVLQADLAQAAAGDQPAAAAPQQHLQCPGRIARRALVEELHQGAHLGVGAAADVQPLDQLSERLHGEDAAT